MSENKILILNTDVDYIAKEEPTRRIVEVALHAPKVSQSYERPKLNLSLVIDCSGSMSGGKLEYVKTAVFHLLDLLGEEDIVSVVAFDTHVETLVYRHNVTDNNRLMMKEQVRRLQPGSSTNLSGGWLRGCHCVAEGLDEAMISRTFLLTDGLANVGIVDIEELGFHSQEIHNRGISTSTFGVGRDYNEFLLERMATLGGGNYYYIESPIMIEDIFMRELENLFTISLRDIEIIIPPFPHIKMNIPGKWKMVKRRQKTHVYIGYVGSDQIREVYLDLPLPAQKGGDKLPINIKIIAKDENNQIIEETGEVVFQYISKEELASKPVNHTVLSLFSLVDVASIAEEALEFERRGERQKALDLMQYRLQEAVPYLASEEVSDYLAYMDQLSRGMDEFERKRRHSQFYHNKQRKQR